MSYHINGINMWSNIYNTIESQSRLHYSIYCFLEALNQMEICLFNDGAPVQSTISLTEGHFKIAGELMVSSVLQGGPAPHFLAGWVYQFISGGLDTVSIQIQDIHKDSLKVVLEKVRDRQHKYM